MEEKPPTQGRDVPRSRSPRAAFSTPEQPTPPHKPAERAPRRAAKAAPPVTFQPPSTADDAETPARPSQKPVSGTDATSPTATPGPAQSPRPARKTTPRVAESTPPGTTTAKTPPAKAPAKSAPDTPRSPGTRQTKATAQPSAAVPPSKPAPARPAPAQAKPAKAASPRSAPKAPEPAAKKRAGHEAAEMTIPAAVETRAEAGEPEPRRTEAWSKLIADPGHAPELLALAAVQTIGPRAREWVRTIREQYPTAADDALARLAAQQFTRFGTLSSIFGAVAGSYAPVALLGAAALTHAELVLHVAAAYGLDPADERRATELLVLTRVHPSAADAEAAMAAAKQPAYEEGGITGAAWRLGRMAAAQTGGWAAVRLLNRLFPGTSLLAATLVSRSSAETVANRARAYYGRERKPA
jgi:hypothetical protein